MTRPEEKRKEQREKEEEEEEEEEGATVKGNTREVKREKRNRGGGVDGPKLTHQGAKDDPPWAQMVQVIRGRSRARRRRREEL